MDKIKKEELIRSTLMGMVQKLGPNGQLPTVKELCARLSASRSTLDRVLRSLEKERILVCRHGSGIFVSPHSNQRRIGLIFGGNIHDPVRYSQFWWLLHHALLGQSERNQDELRTYYSCPTLGSEIDDPADFGLYDDLESRRIAGLIIAGVHSVEQIRWLRQWRVPIVALGEYPEADAAVVLDNDLCMKQGLEALVNAGCKRIAIVATGVSRDAFAEERDAYSVSFKRSASELGITYSPDLRWFENTLPSELVWENHEDAGINIILHHMPKKTASSPDGIFFADDTSAHGGLIALLNKGIIPGKHIKVAVQTNKGASLLRPFNGQIFRVEIDPTKIASEMLRLVHGLINTSKFGGKQVAIKPKLINPGS